MVESIPGNAALPADVVLPREFGIRVDPDEMMAVVFGKPVEKLVSVAGERGIRIDDSALAEHGCLMDQLIVQDPDLELVLVDPLVAVIDLVARVYVQITESVFLRESFGKPRFPRCHMSAHQIHVSHGDPPFR